MTAWTLSGGAIVRFGRGFNADIIASFRSAVHGDVSAPQPDIRVSASTLVNARFGDEADHCGLPCLATIGTPQNMGVMQEAGF